MIDKQELFTLIKNSQMLLNKLEGEILQEVGRIAMANPVLLMLHVDSVDLYKKVWAIVKAGSNYKACKNDEERMFYQSNVMKVCYEISISYRQYRQKKQG